MAVSFSPETTAATEATVPAAPAAPSASSTGTVYVDSDTGSWNRA